MTGATPTDWLRADRRWEGMPSIAPSARPFLTRSAISPSAPGAPIGSGCLLKGVGFTAPALPITPGTPWWALLRTLPARGMPAPPVMAVAVR